MAAFRFIHTSDLHLGRRFSNFPESIRGRLVEARHSVLGRLLEAAEDHDARHILVAGDLFDTETPSADIWRQALAEMCSAEDVTWTVIPGNHDSMAAETLWTNVRKRGGIRVLTEPEPVELAPGVVLLPAPLPSRSPGRDLTVWMAGTEPADDQIRIGLAHGGVTAFGDGIEEIIPPDRAATARLDYLALGDWHGCKAITGRTWYSGTPETDGFKHSGRGTCLAVNIPAPGASPDVRTVETGLFDWEQLELPLTPEAGAAASMESVLWAGSGSRRNMLRRVRASGRVRLPERTALERAAVEMAPEFGFLDLVTSDLRTECAVEDVDRISETGALREAANRLFATANDSSEDEEVRRIAAGALHRLYNYVVET